MTPPKDVPEKGKTLFVGRVIYEGSGIEGKAVNMNGMAVKGIELKITHLSENFTIKTGSEGIFYFLGTATDYYKITQLYIKRTGGNGSWSSHYKNLDGTFIGAKEGVTNIGTFNWVVTNTSSKIQRPDKHKEVMEIFKKLFPDNVWNNEKWTKIFSF